MTATRSDTSALDLERMFQTPPAETRPWVYWFWLNGNITREGITADLEAMKRVGIGGVLIMEVDQGAPRGPMDFASADWRRLFAHAVREAQRMGLQINMNNDAGWNGSGGPWISPDLSMQRVTWSEITVEGPGRVPVLAPQPDTVAGYYRDIVAWAVPDPGGYRIPDIAVKAAYAIGGAGAPIPEILPDGQPIDPRQIIRVDLDESGRGVVDLPPGRWRVIRLGHTSTGVMNAPAPESGRGLECDKLSRAGVEANYNGLIAKLAADNRPYIPAALVATHVDSWENGSQNWTVRMPDEFRQRRGYDLLPWLPVLAGHVVGSPERTERFLWDMRQTVSDLVIEHYAGHLKELAARDGMRFTIEAYGSPCDNLTYAGVADEPMGEFWMGGGALETCRAMASAAHVWGKPICGAEAFTAADQERWLDHPGSIKSLGDRAFCEGINRFVFHRYAMQPWLDRKPGMAMGPWGLHYERTQTWWDWTGPWHTYLARCQYLLRQGHYVADILYVQPEAPPTGLGGGHPLAGYAWDDCDVRALRTRVRVREGRLTLPDGMQYRVLVMPESPAMTPELLETVYALVQQGATVVLRNRPVRAPGLSGYPESDQRVRQLADLLWGDRGPGIHSLGAGRVVLQWSAEQTLGRLGTPPDMSSSARLQWIHRRTRDTDIYFLANTNAFPLDATVRLRASGRVPELWNPETGAVTPAAGWTQDAHTTRLPLRLEGGESVFVVFRRKAGAQRRLRSVMRDGQVVWSIEAQRVAPIRILTAAYGPLDDASRTVDVRERLQRLVDTGATHLVVSQLAEGGDPAFGVVKTLRVTYERNGQRFHLAGRDPDTVEFTGVPVPLQVESARYGVLNDPDRTRDVTARVRAFIDAGMPSFAVSRLADGDDPAPNIVKTIELTILRDGKRVQLTAQDGMEIALVTRRDPLPEVSVTGSDIVGYRSGRYVLLDGSGRSVRRTVTLPQPVNLTGPWQVRLNPGGHAFRLNALRSLSDHPEAQVRYHSGLIRYETTLHVPPASMRQADRWMLDLGQVAVMARVTLNGRPLCTLWHAPYRLDVSAHLHPGTNRLTVEVVNLWPNRMVGDEHLPEDSARNPDGTLPSWPDWLQKGQPSPTGRRTFTTWRLWRKTDPLPPSGLIGPVRLHPGKRLG